MLAILLAILYGLFKVGPDFERVESRQIARVEQGSADASTYYQIGKNYAKEKMWASAVLHFQRAAANEPNRAYYHLAAGKAFLELGFIDRAKDALTSARRLTNNDTVILEIETTLAAIQ
jgi:tetratricopeptide (TPR) repeat protein